MLDPGSEPNVANCSKEFPDHAVRESAGQRQGLMYKGANGALIPNKGEIDVVHREVDGCNARTFLLRRLEPNGRGMPRGPTVHSESLHLRLTGPTTT